MLARVGRRLETLTPDGATTDKTTETDSQSGEAGGGRPALEVDVEELVQATLEAAAAVAVATGDEDDRVASGPAPVFDTIYLLEVLNDIDTLVRRMDGAAAGLLLRGRRREDNVRRKWLADAAPRARGPLEATRIRASSAQRACQQVNAALSASGERLLQSLRNVHRRAHRRAHLQQLLRSVELLRQLATLQGESERALAERRYTDANRLCHQFDTLMRQELASAPPSARGMADRLPVLRDLTERIQHASAEVLQKLYHNLRRQCFAFESETFASIRAAYGALGAEGALVERLTAEYEATLGIARQQALAQGAPMGVLKEAATNAAVEKQARLSAAGVVTNAKVMPVDNADNMPIAPTASDDGTRDLLFVVEWFCGAVSSVWVSLQALLEHLGANARAFVSVWKRAHAQYLVEAQALMREVLAAGEEAMTRVTFRALWRAYMAARTLHAQRQRLLREVVALVGGDDDDDDSSRSGGYDGADRVAEELRVHLEWCPDPVWEGLSDISHRCARMHVEWYKAALRSRMLEASDGSVTWERVRPTWQAAEEGSGNETALADGLHLLATLEQRVADTSVTADTNPVLRVLSEPAADIDAVQVLQALFHSMLAEPTHLLPEESTFVGASLYVLECAATMAPALWIAAPHDADSAPPASTPIAHLLRYAVYLECLQVAPVFLSAGLTNAPVLQLSRAQRHRILRDDYQRALVDALEVEMSHAADADGNARRLRGEWHVGKFCRVVESAWTLGRFGARLLQLAPSEDTAMSEERSAATSAAAARLLRNLADTLQTLLYGSAAVVLVQAENIAREVSGELTPTRPWWPSSLSSPAATPAGQNGGAVETSQPAPSASWSFRLSSKDAANGQSPTDDVPVSRPNAYVERTAERLRALRRTPGVPPRAQDALWRACIEATLRAVVHGVAALPDESLSVRTVSQALLDVHVLISALEEEFGMHPLPLADEACHFIQHHFASVADAARWWARHGDALEAAAGRGLIRHCGYVSGEHAPGGRLTDAEVDAVLDRARDEVEHAAVVCIEDL